LAILSSLSLEALAFYYSYQPWQSYYNTKYARWQALDIIHEGAYNTHIRRRGRCGGPM